MKQLYLTIYVWISTIFYIATLFWLSTIPYLFGENEETTKILLRIAVHSTLYLLIFRTFIITFKNTVDRLSKWKSKREKHEDEEFALIVETLIVLLSISISVIIIVIDEIIQNWTAGRVFSLIDILISTMSIVFMGIVTYSYPILGEFEIYFNNIFKHFLQKK